MPDSLSIQLENQTSSSQVYAYITGLALQHGGARVLVKADGRGLYFPQSPPQLLQPLAVDCAIPRGRPGAMTTVTIPQMAGGRIWFSRDAKLTFLLNPGPALVEPSVLNPSDPNHGVDFAFCEFTLNNDQLFANISYVDFVSRLPVALTLVSAGGAVQHVSGMAADGQDRVAAALPAQAARDHHPWDELVVPAAGGSSSPLRVLSPTHAGAVGASFDGLFEPRVDAAWERFHPDRGGAEMRINTQAAPGVVCGRVDPGSGHLVLQGEAFPRPSTADILGCNTGPFVTGPSPTRNAVIPRLAAAFQRSCVLEDAEHPCHPRAFYTTEPVNHYCRVVHECNLDGKGYAFAYDDVQPDGGADQSGLVFAGVLLLWFVVVGGGFVFVGDRVA